VIVNSTLRTQPTAGARGPEERVELEGSKLPGLAQCQRVSESGLSSTDPITVSILLKGQDSAPAEVGPFHTQAQVAQPNAKQISDVELFAKKNGLSIASVDPDTRTVKLSGSAANYQKAFGVELNEYKDPADTGGKTFRGYEGTLSLPKNLAGSVDGVLGLSNRPLAKPRNTGVRLNNGNSNGLGNGNGNGNGNGTSGPDGLLSGGLSPLTIAKAYNFPKGTDGTGQTISIIELGGGFKQSDLDTYFKKQGVASPNISVVSVDGGQNAPEGKPNGADGEVDLDLEVAGTVAPGAKIKVYFAPNTDQGFIDAENQAAHDQAKDGTPGAVSISWGAPESAWTADGKKSFDSVLHDAAQLGVNTYTASGDNGSSDGVNDKKNHVDFPSASTWNISTGGTNLKVDANGNRTAEKAWGGSFFGGAAGGGFADETKAPDFQKKALEPWAAQNPNGGRGVPDISGDADPATGYDVLVDGQESSIGGTSAVAPLMAALNARLNQGLGSPTGYLNPFFYDHTDAFTDITKGTNGAFKAGPGWDPITGIGVPDGEKLLAALKAAHASQAAQA